MTPLATIQAARLQAAMPKGPLAAHSAADANMTDAAPKAASKATVEQTYVKLTQHEHILQRPDTYIGSTEGITTDMWVFDDDGGRGKMKQRKLTYVPGLYKTFDEILVNAADNKQRDASMSEIRIDIDREANRITVQNNGKGIPVVVHEEYGIYVPELIFGAPRRDAAHPAERL